MSDLTERASAILKEFKGNTYTFGRGVLDEAPGKFAAEFGKSGFINKQFYIFVTADSEMEAAKTADVEIFLQLVFESRFAASITFQP